MKIIHIAAEIAPAAKVGGLGDVVYGLARAFSLMGNNVSVVIPFYASLNRHAIEDLKFLEQCDPYSVWEGRVDGFKIYFIEIPGAFTGSSIYGGANEKSDFIHFSWYAFQWVSKQAEKPDVIHLHDWHVSAIPLFAKGAYKIIGTIHNFDYQGITERHLIERFGVNLHDFPGIEQEEHTINLLKALILYSHRVNTVSATYAKEALYTSEGRGLQDTLKHVNGRFSGILNGIDYDYWNPETDMYLPHHYSSHDIEPKKLLKHELRERTGLAHNTRPLMGIVSRLVPQKGIHLMTHAIERAGDYGYQIVMSGSAYDPETKSLFERLQQQFATDPNVRIHLGYDEKLAQWIYGASDMFLIPSLFEPCGLTQLISLRYGSVPVVRHTGGLADTVIDIDTPGKSFLHANGFSFTDPTPAAMDAALARAMHLWHGNPLQWTALQRQGMEQDFSWKKSAQQYLDLYCSV